MSRQKRKTSQIQFLANENLAATTESNHQYLFLFSKGFLSFESVLIHTCRVRPEYLGHSTFFLDEGSLLLGPSELSLLRAEEAQITQPLFRGNVLVSNQPDDHLMDFFSVSPCCCTGERRESQI